MKRLLLLTVTHALALAIGFALGTYTWCETFSMFISAAKYR